MRETVVEQYLKRRVEEHGGECVKLQRLPGWPDRLVIIPGHKSPYTGDWYELAEVWFIETKRPRGGQLSRVQKAVHRRLGVSYGLGCRVEVLKSKAEVDAWVERYVAPLKD